MIDCKGRKSFVKPFRKGIVEGTFPIRKAAFAAPPDSVSAYPVWTNNSPEDACRADRRRGKPKHFRFPPYQPIISATPSGPTNSHPSKRTRTQTSYYYERIPCANVLSKNSLPSAPHKSQTHKQLCRCVIIRPPHEWYKIQNTEKSLPCAPFESVENRKWETSS
jgi:hypothetical protein